MYYPRRLCIPFGIDCNFSCAYCYRDRCRKPLPTAPTPAFQAYLQSLPRSTYAVIASGGEPLLYFPMIQTVFSLVPVHVHKKIMTNGSLLTDSIVQWCNANHVEVHLSHDGEKTKDLRGCDIFESPRLVRLVRELRYVRVVAVATNQNCDVLQLYHDIQQTLRRPFYFQVLPVEDTGHNLQLVTGFDYDTYERTLLQLYQEREDIPLSWYAPPAGKAKGYNVLLDGRVVGIETLRTYGTVWDTEASLRAGFMKQEAQNIARCRQRTCAIRKVCTLSATRCSPHMCRLERIHADCRAFLQNGGCNTYD